MAGVSPSGPVASFTVCEGLGFDIEGSVLVAALIAAFRTVVYGGLIPQAKHGGKWEDAAGAAASKFDGTGFENEQIGQIQVAFIGLGEGELGAMACGRGESDLPG